MCLHFKKFVWTPHSLPPTGKFSIGIPAKKVFAVKFFVNYVNLREGICMVGKYRIDGGSQVEHLLGHLAAAWTRKVGKDLAARNRYQVVFHPAMSMIDMFDNIYTNFH